MTNTSHTRQRRSVKWAALTVLVAGLAAISIPGGAPGSAGGSQESAIQKARDKADRLRSVNNLKIIDRAIHNFYDQNKRFPADGRDKDGKPTVSWRVYLARFLESVENEYDAVKLSEPWDSPHNKKILAKIPKEFSPPLGKATKAREGETFYQAFVGDSSILATAITIKRGPQDVTDGLSKTIMVVEGASPVHWAKPGGDLPFDPAKPLPKLGGLFPDGFHALFGDGHVSFIPKDIKPDVLKALITRNGGEKLPRDY